MSTPKPLDTPRSSDIETSARLPPSPPLSPKKRATSLSAVDRLLRTLRLRKAGKLSTDEDWKVFKLSRAKYDEFERRVRQDEALWGWCEDKVRYDWEPEPEEAGGGEGRGRGRGRVVLRMPTALHERFIVKVEDAIGAGIATLARRLSASGKDDDGKVAEELRKIYKGGSPTLELKVPRLENSSQESTASDAKEVIVKRSPDATFYHPSQPQYPCLVLEVSYSQSQKDLPRLAESYVVDSQHAIRCVIGLDITYPSRDKIKMQDRSATVSFWRPGVEKDGEGEDVGVCVQELEAVPFRDVAGGACEGGFEIKLLDLLPPAMLSTLPTSTANENLSISFSDLATYLGDAEAQTATPTTSFASTASSSAPKKFRKRKRTPPEELSDEREAEYERQEEHEMKKDRRVDGEWRARSRRRTGSEVGDVVEVVERRRSSRRRASGRAIGQGS